MEALLEVGSCNTQLAARIDRLCSVQEIGIDTWRLARYLDDDDDLRRAVRLLGGRTFQKIEGHAVGVLPDRRMLWLEGHPAVDGLAAPRTLPASQDRLLDGLHDLGLPRGRDGGLRRFDQTATLRFDDRAAGLAFLRGMAAVDVPRCKKAVYESAAGHPETVYLLGPGRSRRVLARCYDKGVESGIAPRGQLIRLENQTRVSKQAGEYITAESCAEHSALVGTHFDRRFAPVAESVDGVLAATASVLADRVSELISEGRLSPAMGFRLLGFLVAGDRVDVPERTSRRYRAHLRRLGLVLVDPLVDEIEVDLGVPLDAALAAWSAQ